MNSQDVSIITVAAVRAKAAIIAGEIGGVGVEMMLDSGSTVSLIQTRYYKTTPPSKHRKITGHPRATTNYSIGRTTTSRRSHRSFNTTEKTGIQTQVRSCQQIDHTCNFGR